MPRCDAVILAGGRASAEMERRAGTALRALFPYQGKPFVTHVLDAVRASRNVHRIAVVGPNEIGAVLSDVDLFVQERDTMEANLFGALEILAPDGHVLITASDNPLLTTAAFDDFLLRSPENAALCYPILRHETFLRRFPTAANIAVPLRDGVFIGGCCALAHAQYLPALRDSIRRVIQARKSKRDLLNLLGWVFGLRFAIRRVTSHDLENHLSQISGVPIRFIRDCDPVLPIDIDDPEDWDYLQALKMEARHAGDSSCVDQRFE